MMGRSGNWVGASGAGAISNGRWWYYQDYAAASGPGLTISQNDNGTGGTFSTAKIVNTSAVATDTNGNPIYTGVPSTDLNLVTVTSQIGASVTLSGVPDASYGTVRIWYLYTETTGALPTNMEVAPDFVKQTRVQWLDLNYLNQNDNLSDLPNAGTARTNLGFTSQTTGQVYYGAGGTLPTSDANMFWDSSNKRLGIGTSSPQSRSHLNDSGANALALQVTNSVSGATSGDGLLVGLDASANCVINQQENLDIIVSTNATEMARFKSTGYLLLKKGVDIEDPGAGTNTVRIQAPTLGSGYTITLPVDDGNSGETISTDGSGVLSWQANGGTVLTTKGDLFTYSTANARLPVGATFGQVLVVDSSQTTGLKWGSVIKAGSTAISTTQTTKAIPFTNPMPSQSYSVYASLANYVDATPQFMVVQCIAKTTAGFTVEWDNQTDSANYTLEWQAIGHSS
jgi:hypothetical protein